MLSLLNRTINSVASVPTSPVVNVEDDKIQLLQSSNDVPSASILADLNWFLKKELNYLEFLITCKDM